MKNQEIAIKLIDELCSKCSVCYSVCPFEAISRDAETGEVAIQIEKCQVCGLCVSACPSSCIETVYYDYDLLTQYLEAQMKALATGNLVLMCRGSSPPSADVSDVLKEQNLDKFISLRLPCVGRLSPEFYLKALTLGLDKLVIVQCDQDFCRMKQGSENNIRRVKLLQLLLEQSGYGGDVLTIIKNPQRVVYDTEECVGCGKCAFICPYEAIELQSMSTPQVSDACQGCGACAVICPHIAIQVKGFEYEFSPEIIEDYQAKVAEKKAKGISPVVLVFCCHWSEFSALEKRNHGSVRENVFITEIPCLSKLDPAQVLQALSLGFDGVMAFGHSRDDCLLKEGRDVVESNISILNLILERMNRAHRFELVEGSPRYVGDFDSKLNSFIDRISALTKAKKR